MENQIIDNNQKKVNAGRITRIMLFVVGLVLAILGSLGLIRLLGESFYECMTCGILLVGAFYVLIAGLFLISLSLFLRFWKFILIIFILLLAAPWVLMLLG